MTPLAVPVVRGAGRRAGAGSPGSDGRLGVYGRLAAFLGVFLFLLLVLNAVALWAGGAPTAERPLTWQAALAFAGAAAAANAFAMERLEGRPTAALGMPLGRGTVRWLGWGFLTGAGIIGLALAILVAGGWLSWQRAPIRGPSALGEVAAITAVLLPAAWGEELLFRGYPLQALAQRWGGPAAIAAPALAFAAVHAANPAVSGLALANLALAGVVLGLAWWRTYSLWFATGVHLGWNWVMGVAVDLPVSGIALDAPGIDAVLRGPELWTGGAFGPEGGLAMTLAALVAVAWLAGSRRPGRDVVALALSPLPERRRAPASGRVGPGGAAGRRPGVAVEEPSEGEADGG